MLDPAIIAELQRRIVPPSPPAIERSVYADGIAQTEQRSRERAENYAKRVTGWIADIANLRGRLTQELPLDAEIMPTIAQTIENAERLADRRARDVVRLTKKANRQGRVFRAQNATVAALFERSISVLIESDKELVSALLEFALFLRSVRADADPDARGGPAFSDPDELRRYLARALA